jgi:hypothetical protein
MSSFYNSTDEYLTIWNKYRPAILKCMVACEAGPQQYQFFQHEFKALNPKEKGGYTFTLQVSGGRPSNNIKDSRLAQQLLTVIGQSKRGAELMSLADYEFVLGKNLVLTVSKRDNATKPA